MAGSGEHFNCFILRSQIFGIVFWLSLYMFRVAVLGACCRKLSQMRYLTPFHSH
jgi:hypothetical protein